MHKKYIVFVLIPALLFHLHGCYSMKDISKDEMVGLQDGDDLIVHTKDSIIYSFEKSDCYISKDTLYVKGFVKFNEDDDFKVPIQESIEFAKIESIQLDELNPTNTTWLIIGSILLVDIVVLGLQVIAHLSGI